MELRELAEHGRKGAKKVVECIVHQFIDSSSDSLHAELRDHHSFTDLSSETIYFHETHNFEIFAVLRGKQRTHS